MNPLVWLMRMSRWARNPPSPQRVKIVLGAIALAFALWGLELAGLWPDWATLDKPARPPRLP
ncbi:hypothetical protein CCR83_01330 [Rhodobacter veldkampii DSM 11550]|uniref:Uncharacterized protein n=1 Tax=Phaeovulum veldkampii DSM 11550 TaxID=1185920 RepID=A0A2T4JGR1_9RHOB|nr:hypothetical protein [Phaeovulum veldkampii]MBK5945121.1 hypothetical protein [Phaeovulum veldkampii DSM 11550]PTE17105.1 hypothetical protein C5F46_11025 [Phaeovulum veldkampii DSM 11550]TDQ64572.1 hypothetical protein EV658_10133 [Phaeovulum veldkampii DSM 11550]